MALQLTSASDVVNLRCLPVEQGPGQSSSLALTEIRIDSAYFNYQVSCTHATQSMPSCSQPRCLCMQDLCCAAKRQCCMRAAGNFALAWLESGWDQGL